MLITTNPQQTLWETVLPPGYQDLPRELAAVDALLDDPCSSSPTGRNSRRGGRSEQARLAVLEAADDLLVEKGFAGVTVEGIAARAGVAKQTVYRWWRTKTDVLLDAFLQDMAEEPVPPDHGDIAGDLRAHVRALAGSLSESDHGAVFRALVAQAQHDPAFAAVFRARFVDEQRRRDRVPLERAAARGELPAGLDVAVETDQLVGPVYYRLLVTGEPVGEEFTDRLVESLLRRLVASPALGNRHR